MYRISLTLLGFIGLVSCSEEKQVVLELVNPTQEMAEISYKQYSGNGKEVMKSFHKVVDSSKNQADSIIGYKEDLKKVSSKGHLIKLENPIQENELAVSSALNSDKPIHFLDPVLEKLIRKKIDKPRGAIFCRDVEGITMFSYNAYSSQEKIQNISGLEHLVNLKELVLFFNEISDPVPLYNLAKLRRLYIEDANLTVEQIEEVKSKLPDCLIYF